LFTTTCPFAKNANNRNLECLRYAHENGCPWNARTCTFAAISGNIDCLKYAHENNCPWNEETTNAAAEFGNVDCLKYAIENGCNWLFLNLTTLYVLMGISLRFLINLTRF
jgi:hypothetical protein